ncbi:serine/arginine repetitive matrix protein 1-like [Falco rusticolus]|uniref:serine/arginine repetitive matrix protein 1-like n=1 Tax=Falco rusticolus TaxID=120794 RepID=UPI0018865768|nr:serine/arginine repetitive matrix protein 1-like [Falco rusticolus]
MGASQLRSGAPGAARRELAPLSLRQRRDAAPAGRGQGPPASSGRRRGGDRYPPLRRRAAPTWPPLPSRPPSGTTPSSLGRAGTDLAPSRTAQPGSPGGTESLQAKQAATECRQPGTLSPVLLRKPRLLLPLLARNGLRAMATKKNRPSPEEQHLSFLPVRQEQQPPLFLSLPSVRYNPVPIPRL